MVLWSVALKIGAFTKLGLFFPVLCFIYVFDQTLAEQLYRDKGLFHDNVLNYKCRSLMSTLFVPQFPACQNWKSTFSNHAHVVSTSTKNKTSFKEKISEGE